MGNGLEFEEEESATAMNVEVAKFPMAKLNQPTFRSGSRSLPLKLLLPCGKHIFDTFLTKAGRSMTDSYFSLLFTLSSREAS